MKETNLSQTQRISSLDKSNGTEVNSILKQVYDALIEKGYSPTNQLVGYILSGDPTYITASNNARNLITKLERDELLEDIINFYLKNSL